MHPLIKPLTSAILILALLSAGCTNMGGGSVDSPAAVATENQAATSTPELTPEATENWWDDRPHYNPAVIKADDNLFGVDIAGIKYQKNTIGYQMYDEKVNRIFKHRVYTSFDLYSELQPEQARALEDQYGYPESVVMEQADTDATARWTRSL